MFIFKKINPSAADKADEFFKAGIEYKNACNYPESKKCFEQALELQPDSKIIKLKLWQVEKECMQNNDCVTKRT